jgi:hypothetical protein
MARDEAPTDRREDLHGRNDSQEGREDSRDGLHEERRISPEKISGRTHSERRPQRGISPNAISGG